MELVLQLKRHEQSGSSRIARVWEIQMGTI